MKSLAACQPNAFRRWAFLTIAGMLFFASAASAQVEAPSSEVLVAILDAIRGITIAQLGAPIRFAVDDIRVVDGWAFATVRPQRPDGAAINYSQTRYHRSWKWGMLDERAVALLHESTSGWLVYAYCFGSSDIDWILWPDLYAAPPEVYPKPAHGWVIFAPESRGGC